MKKLISLLLAALLLAVTVSAQAPSVVDKEGLLSLTEAETLENSFNQYHEEFGFTVAAATAESFGELSAEEYARKCYANNGYDNDGILLLISEGEGQWYIYTSGICAQAISDSDAALIGEALTEDLVAGNYYNAFKTFAEKGTVPVCERLNADAVAADAERNELRIYMTIGLMGGLAVGVLVAVVLWFIARRSKTAKYAGQYTSNE